MTLGTLNRHLHTLSRSGRDSIYTVKVTGSLYPLTIDQVNQRIFNVDSLPVGTDAKKIVFSGLTATGTVAIQSKVTGKDTLLNQKDSIDFSTPRIITVYATDGVSNRKYQVDIRVHKEWGDSMIWQRTASGLSAFSSVRQLHALTVESTLYAFGLEGTMPVVLTANTASPQQWTRHAITPATLDAHSVVRHGNSFFALASNQLMTSEDGIKLESCELHWWPQLLHTVGGQWHETPLGPLGRKPGEQHRWRKDLDSRWPRLLGSAASGRERRHRVCLHRE